MSILNLIGQVPAVIWSAVIASLLAFGGVLLSNWISLSALNRRMTYEAEEAARKRKSDIRKEVYLDAATQLVRSNIYLGSLSQKPLPAMDLEGGLAGFSVAAAKLQMLMEAESAILAGEISACYSKIYIKVLPKLSPIHALQADIEFKRSWLERIQSEVSRILSLQVAHNESGNNDQAHFGRLQQSFEDQHALQIQVGRESRELWAKLLPLQRELSLQILEEIKTMQPMGVKLLIAMRHDFEVGGDEDVFLASAEKNMGEVMAELNSSLAKIDA